MVGTSKKNGSKLVRSAGRIAKISLFNALNGKNDILFVEITQILKRRFLAGKTCKLRGKGEREGGREGGGGEEKRPARFLIAMAEVETMAL